MTRFENLQLSVGKLKFSALLHFLNQRRCCCC